VKKCKKKTFLKQVIIEQKELIKPSKEYIEREKIKDVSNFIKLKHIIVIKGHRRAGKSVFLSQIINQFYGLENIYYLNLDDERLSPITLKDMNNVMEVFNILFGKKNIIFID